MNHPFISATTPRSIANFHLTSDTPSLELIPSDKTVPGEESWSNKTPMYVLCSNNFSITMSTSTWSSELPSAGDNTTNVTATGRRRRFYWLCFVYLNTLLLCTTVGDSLFNSLFVYTIARSHRRVHSCMALDLCRLADNARLAVKTGKVRRVNFCNWPEFYCLICVCVNKINTRRSLYLLNEQRADGDDETIE